MELFNMATLYYDRFIPVFIRIAVMISFIPFIGAAMTPLFVRAGFILAFTLLVLPVANVDTTRPVKALFDAFFIGSAMGLSVRLVMSAIETAAQWMSIQMGFGMAAVFNPQFGEQLGPLSLFYTYMGMVMFFMLGIHHAFIEGVMRSFELGTLRFNNILQAILVLNAYFFPLALKIAAPVLLVQTVINIANGFVAKTMPQANIFFVGMPLQIMLGFLFIIASMSLSLMVIGRSFMHIKDAFETITR